MSSDAVPKDLVQKIRDVALQFPDAVEKETWGHPTFRIRDKMFASCGVSEDGTVTMTMKAAPGEQRLLLESGDPFFYPKYVGTSGWIGVSITTDTDWEEINELTEESFRQVAPARVVAQLDGE